MNTLVLQRFRELETKANSILDAKQFDFQSDDGVAYYKVCSPEVTAWATSVLNLLQRVFNEDAMHFKQFQIRFESFNEWESGFRECFAVFQSAKEDYEGGYLFNPAFPI